MEAATSLLSCMYKSKKKNIKQNNTPNPSGTWIHSFLLFILLFSSFKMRRGRILCVDPNEKWPREVMKMLDACKAPKGTGKHFKKVGVEIRTSIK